MSLFGRIVELDIGTAGSAGKRFTGLHVDFRVESGMNGEPAKAKITAYNLAEDTIGRLQAPGAVVRLSVGYQGEPARLVLRYAVAADEHFAEVAQGAGFPLGGGRLEFREVGPGAAPAAGARDEHGRGIGRGGHDGGGEQEGEEGQLHGWEGSSV